jgi:3-deoxy-manno-octulosonate cytidylyltransferase (CMP-KDO synthetase)
MKTIVVIPSRYESSRFNGKPLALIAGKPMIQRVCDQVRQASGIDRVVVATDDERIHNAVEAFGGEAMITSRENKSGTDRVAEAARAIGLSPEDIVVNVQGDQPLVDPRSIESAVSPFLSDPALDMSTLAFKIERQEEISNPKDVKVTFDQAGFALYFSRSPIPCARDTHTVFDTYKHLGVYAYTKRFLDIFTGLPEGRLESIEKLEQLRALENGYRIKVVITEYDSPEVDLPEDIQRIEKNIFV